MGNNLVNLIINGLVFLDVELVKTENKVITVYKDNKILTHIDFNYYKLKFLPSGKSYIVRERV